MSEKRVAFLFGAGADRSLGVSSGDNFSMNVLGLTDSSADMNKAIEKYIKHILTNENCWYPSYQQFTWKKEKLIEASIRKKILTEQRNHYKLKKDFEKVIDLEKQKIDDVSAKKLIDSYTSYMGILDEKFHTIISPIALGPSKFWGVISCYYRAYLLIVSEILEKNVTYDDILSNHKETYKKVCYSCEKKINNKNYYTPLDSYADIVSGIITANYTPYVEKICKNLKCDIAYPHGKIGWFECPETLKIFDLTEGDSDIAEGTIVFPFLFLQSGIKPIISKKQISEYSKFIGILDCSNVLIVVGYRFNYDDNHLNSIIAEWLKEDQNHKLIYFNYLDDNTLPFNFGQLPCFGNLDVLTINYSENQNISISNKITDIHVDNTNSIDAYENYIKELAKN